MSRRDDRDNPYSPPPGVDALPTGANEAGTLEPVDIDVSAVIGRAWELTQRNPGVVAGAVLIPAIPQVLLQVLQQFLQVFAERASPDQLQLMMGGFLVVYLVTSIVSLWLTLGQARVVTRLTRGLDADVAMVFGEYERMPGAVAAWFLLSLAVTAGTCLLFVPGIILGVGLGFTFYVMVDQDLGPVESLTESWRLTDGYKGQIFGTTLLISLLGFMMACFTLGFGFVLLAPVLTLCQGVIYHSLVSSNPRP